MLIEMAGTVIPNWTFRVLDTDGGQTAGEKNRFLVLDNVFKLVQLGS